MTFPTFLLHEFLLDFHNDRKTLYTCALVNREWCRITIPLLWKNPIELLHGPDDYYPYHRYRNNHVKLVDTYLSYLNNEERVKLIKNGFKLPLRIKPPIFDYISFLRYISNGDIQMISLFWCLYFDASKIPVVNPLNSLSTKRKIKVTSSLWNLIRDIFDIFNKRPRTIATEIAQVAHASVVPPMGDDFYTTDVLLKSEIIHHTLTKLIIEQCPNINHLQSTSTLIGSSSINNYTEIVLKYPRLHECFSHLKSFESRSNFYRGTSFDILSEICHQLRKIEVSSCNPTHLSSTINDNKENPAIIESQKLSNLIRVQRYLREFILWNCKLGILDIITSLVSTQQYSMRELSFHHCDFQNIIWLHLLSDLPNLEALTFNQCINVSEQTSSKLVLSNLKHLKYIYGYTSPNALITLLESTKDSLVELDTGKPHFKLNLITFDPRKFHFLESDLFNHLELLHNIKLCKNLTSLSTYVYSNTQENLFTTLINLDQLKKLVITEISYSLDSKQKCSIFSEFLTKLANHLPSTLQWLHIGTKFGIRKNILEEFKLITLCKFKKLVVFGGLDWDMENQKVEFEGIYEELNIDDIKNSLIPNYDSNT
ncbi:14784_t:CDS:2 [Cetraspora pellucida]|uniref:14784_t:CDS:1 n=1 Tax=Cetraspora pellucida TaxID=1433469 RepID=A0A9N8VPC7_9GLOM|nr:14784_t:CDS:2 [Cetraspora pellucida]